MPATLDPRNLHAAAASVRSALSVVGTGLTGTSSISSFAVSTNPTITSSTDTTSTSFSFNELDGKDPNHQLDVLTHQLELETRIKEGAENLLNMQMIDSLRLQVESELDMANNKIEALTKRIEHTRARKKTNGSSPAIRKYAGQAPPLNIKPKEHPDDKEDLRTSLHNAQDFLRVLQSLETHVVAPPSSSGPIDVDRARCESMSKITAILQRNLRVRYEMNTREVIYACLPALADRSPKQCRAAAYRLVRHVLVDMDSLEQLREQKLDWYIVKSLSRDNKHAGEKEQVIKLIRAIVEISSARREHEAAGSGSVPLSDAVMRAFIAVAEHAEDPFRPICIQTLAELLLIDIDLVARTGGIRFLLHALGEGPMELSTILASTFLYIIDSPRTRAYLHVGSDLEIALSAITDAYGKGPDHSERMKGCSKFIQLMLRTWSGLMYFCMDDMMAIKSLVGTLRIPSLDTREIILDMFFDLFNIKTPEWYKTFIDGRRLTMYRKSRLLPSNTRGDTEPDRPQQYKLTDQYIALLIVIFTNAGLLDALTAMLEESTTGGPLSRKATLLMAEVLQMANRVLPLSVAARLQAIPRVFGLASDYTHGEHRIVGTSAFAAIDSFNRNKLRLQPSTVLPNSRPRANSVEDAVRRGQRQLEQSKIKMAMAMDDRTFQASLLETQVMLTDEYTKWNFDMLQDLIEGPLLNPKRMEEAIKVSRFVRKLMSFFHPLAHRFSDIVKLKANIRWVRLGCTFLTTLLASADGLRFLLEDKFMKQIALSFAQLDPFNGTPDSDPILSKKRVSDTLTYGYLEMLGTLSKHKEGVELMEKFKIFTAFYHLSELRSREDLIKGIIENLDYSIDGHPRIVLSKALTSSYKHIRLYATNHLGALIRAAPKANAWTLRLLLTQLYDPSPDVCEMAIHFLEEACEDKDVLQLVVEMQPTMDHLGEVGAPLLLKFMSTPIGFRYLYDAGYIDREIDMWFHERNVYYVIQVEVFLAKVFSPNSSEEDEDMLAFDGTVPPHFYGEMAKTELGREVLTEKGHFLDFSEFIQQHGMECEDPDVIMKLKSTLWAVGSIGSTEGGLAFLEEEETIPVIMEIAEHSEIPSIRGTCFFVFGLISSTSLGAEILDDFHWDATLSPLGVPTGLCIPSDVPKFMALPLWEPTLTATNERSRLIPPTSETELEVVTAIQNLQNTVIANTACRSLDKMKTRPEYRHVFSSPTMFFRALHIISTSRYRFPVRRYVINLFEVELNANTVITLNESAEKLRAPAAFKAPQTSNRLSMFGGFGRSIRKGTESDEEEEDEVMLEGVKEENGQHQPEPEALKMRPQRTVVGFNP